MNNSATPVDRDLLARDPQLARLFANQNETLPISDFLPRLVARLEREQRRQQIVWAALMIAVVVLASILAPWIAEIAASLNDVVADCVAAIGLFLASPIVLLTLGALVLAFLPPLVIWRYWRG